MAKRPKTILNRVFIAAACATATGYEWADLEVVSEARPNWGRPCVSPHYPPCYVILPGDEEEIFSQLFPHATSEETEESLERPATDRILTDGIPWSQAKQRLQRGDPLLVAPDLYRCFTDMPATEESFRTMAADWGWLDEPETVILQTENGPKPAYGERFLTWRFHHEWLLRAIRVRNMLNDKIPKSMREHIEWGPDGVFYWQGVATPKTGNKCMRLPIAVRGQASGWRMDYLREGDAPPVLEWFLTDRIDQMLSDHTCIQKMYDPTTRQFEKHAVAKTLIGAMWLQFDQECEQGIRDYRVCNNCKDWFPIRNGTKEKRADPWHKGFCTEECQKYYKDHKRRSA